jgi:hypothetical protein
VLAQSSRPWRSSRATGSGEQQSNGWFFFLLLFLSLFGLSHEMLIAPKLNCRIANNEISFADLARTESDCGSAAQGGELM